MLTKLSSLSITKLESVISKYPWFALARKELYMRTSVMGEDYRRLGMKRAGIYLPSREQLAREGSTKERKKILQSTEEVAIDYKDKQTIRVIGGDWFSQEDLNSIEEKYLDFEEELPSIPEQNDTIPSISDEQFYTETLARIYGEQELHQMAIDVYEKLILIYPEKSTYFAALIEEQKKHLKD